MDEEFVGRGLVTLSGEEHLARRRLELPLFQLERMGEVEQTVLPRILAEFRDDLAQLRGPDSLVRVDLLWLAGVATAWSLAPTLGIDAPDAAAGKRLDEIARGVRAASRVGASSEAQARGREAQQELRRDFVQPALVRRRALVAAGRPLERDDLVSILVGEGFDDDVVSTEVSMFLVGAGTPGMTTTRTVLNLEQWFADHPEDREKRFDVTFLTQAAVESIRLAPPSIMARRALRDVTVAGISFAAGDVLAIEHAAVNADVEAFGADATEFDPYRKLGPRRFASSFGGGAHMCIGRRFAITQSEPPTPPGSPVGVQVRMVEWLYRMGVELDPADPPEWGTERVYLPGYLDEPVAERPVLQRCPAILTHA
jgi:cytochrome P450